MAGKKRTGTKAAAAPKSDTPKAPEAPSAAEIESKKVVSPISTTGAIPVYRVDLGESLP